MDAVGTAAARIARPGLARRLVEALDTGHVYLAAGAGYGKTTALEEALERSERRAVWVGCGEAGDDPGRLLLGAVAGLRAAVPGLADVVGDGLVTSAEAMDVRIATSALMAELEGLLVEPLAIVFDDAEELEGVPAALAMIEQLMAIRGVPLSLAVATRRQLPLRLAKLRAAGRLTELGPAELGFSAGECAELLSLRHGREVSEDEVAGALAANAGWPMGIALTGLAGQGEAEPGWASHDDLFRFLAEEVLDRLEPERRLALVDSSVPDTLTPALAGDLGLPPGFLSDTVRQGLFLRMQGPGTYSYHPLFRTFLREQLPELRTEPERAELHACIADSLAGSGEHAQSIEHWLEAGRYAEALTTLTSHARELVRTAPGSVQQWLGRMPHESRSDPAYNLLTGHLLWASGRHEEALGPLRAAAAGYRRSGDAGREWVARLFLVDAVFSVGAFGEISEIVEGWDSVTDPSAAETAAGVAWYEVIAIASSGRPADAEELAERLRAEADRSGRFAYADAVARVGMEPAAGRGRGTLELLHRTIAELEREDRYGSLPYELAMVSLVLRDLGEREAALEWLDRCQREAERIGLGFVTRDCQLQRATLLAMAGRLPEAEIELARAGPRRGTGWRGVHRHEAEAQVAALRGDAAEAVAAAQRALKRVAPGALCYRVWTAVDMAPVLADNGAPEAARVTVDQTLADFDQAFPGERGRLHRARLLAARARLEYAAGGPEAACLTLASCWEEAGDQADTIVRVHWPGLRPVLWRALAEGTLTAESVLPAMQEAFPSGEALIAMVDHPEPDVRRTAILTALAAGHPAVLARLERLPEHADDQVASAAAAMRERMRTQPLPLRFELLGGFRVRRAGWELPESDWKRPMAARVVRFLLLQDGAAVPEDVLFEAFWADRDADSARQHLTVAVSRARKVLDLPGAEASMIEAKERTYRLRLGERDVVDSAEFERAAALSLTDRGAGRRAALERAAALWTGEPLPEDRYAEWTFAWRERLVATYTQVLSELVGHYDRAGDHHEAIRAAQRLLEVDPLDERAHRQLMTSYARAGRTSYALRQYLECRRALVVDLGVEPAAETSRLQARILAGEAV